MKIGKGEHRIKVGLSVATTVMCCNTVPGGGLITARLRSANWQLGIIRNTAAAAF